MSTPRLRASNQINALRSTGPVTERGRAAVRSNALVHGFYSRLEKSLVLDPDQYQALLDDFLADYRPAGAAETELVHRIVRDLHKSRRLEEAELTYLATVIDRNIDNVGEHHTDPAFRAIIALEDHLADDFLRSKSLVPLERFEMLAHRLRRAVDKSTQVLREMQRDRLQSDRARLASASDLVDPASRLSPDSADPAPSLAPDSVSSVDPAPRSASDPTPPLVTTDPDPAHAPLAQQPNRADATPADAAGPADKTESKGNVTPPAPSEQTPNPEIGFVPHKPVSTSPTPPRKPRKAA